MITLVSTWYNESMIAPFFFSHYDSFIDRYVIFVDGDTTDDTLNLLWQKPNVEVIIFQNDNGWDAFNHAERQMELYKTIKEGHVLFADADEFAFPFKAKGDVHLLNMVQVFRHKDDSDLDASLPVVYQRRHGVISTPRCPATLYTKPCIIKAGLNVWWEVVGHHQLFGNFVLSDEMMQGVHWQMADPLLAIERNVKNRVGRNSFQNKMLGAASHFDEYTEEGIWFECMQHANDPRLF